MDSKGFFLGLIAAVVLFLLWKKETGQSFSLPALNPQPANGPSAGGCAGGCGGGANPTPRLPTSPVEQAMLAISGTDGLISPGTPPLGTVTGSGSFYGASGPTPDNTFPIESASLPVLRATSDMIRIPGVVYGNVPGSATTPSNQVPIRAVQQVAPTSQLGFQQRYNYVGIPRTAGARQLVN